MDDIEEFESSGESESPLLTKQHSLGIEKVDNDEFVFLDGVSELATLTSGRQSRFQIPTILYHFRSRGLSMNTR